MSRDCEKYLTCFYKKKNYNEKSQKIRNARRIKMKTRDKYRGCLLGGAAGDALGYAVEFAGEEVIFQKYGEHGITEYELDKSGKALFSDDTQMTLFTANSLLLHTEEILKNERDDSYRDFFEYCYRCWYFTQGEEENEESDEEKSWLMQVPELYSRRAPGLTCLSAFHSGKIGSVAKPMNESKGCGGVMRVAPVGLYLDEKNHTLEQVGKIGAEAAALTHGHELGYIPAAVFAMIVHLAVNREDLSMMEIVETALDEVWYAFPEGEFMKQFQDLMNLALDLAVNDEDDLDAIHHLGAGWVAEEALAIATYCAVKYEHDFEKGIIAAVNHGGDSDSTGAIAGNILGAYLGIDAIPEKYKENLELKEVILRMADELYDFPEPEKVKKEEETKEKPKARILFRLR